MTKVRTQQSVKVQEAKPKAETRKTKTPLASSSEPGSGMPSPSVASTLGAGEGGPIGGPSGRGVSSSALQAPKVEAAAVAKLNLGKDGGGRSAKQRQGNADMQTLVTDMAKLVLQYDQAIA